jgi:Asp-tRNA(Asn)/Glu-tRNA(Gln) amidotransferase C subunit
MEFKKPPTNEAEFRSKLETVSAYVNLYQTYLLKVIHAKKMELSNLEYLMKLPEKLNHLPKIKVLEGIVERLYHKIADIDAFFEVNALLLKKVVKTPTLLCNAEKNIRADVFDEKITETPDKFVAWFLSS